MFRAVFSICMVAGAAAAQIVICNNADLRVVPVALQDGFTATQLMPSLISVRVIDACGQDVRLVAARAEFSSGDVPVPLQPAGNLWSGIWRPLNRPTEDVQVIFTAIDAGSELRPVGVSIIRGRLLPRADGSGSLQIDSTSIRVSSTSGSGVQTRSIVITNPANSAQRFSTAVRTTNGGNWLRVADSGTAIPAATSGAVIVNLDATGLAPGTYAGAVDVTAGSATATVPVTFAVSSAQARIELSTVATSFNAEAGGRVDPPQQVIIRNPGAVPLQWSARASTTAGESWLNASPAQGTTAAGGVSVVQVAAVPAGLPTGEYFGRVSFTAANAANSPQSLSIYLNVAAAGSMLSSSVRPTALVFGGESLTEQRLSFFNATSQPVRVRLLAANPADDRWVSVPATIATVASGQTADIPVTAVLTEQASARYAAISVVNLTAGTTTTVPVVAVPRSVPGTASDKSPRAADCSPSSLVARMLSVNSTTTLRVGEAKTIDAVVRDNCGTGLSSNRGGSASLRVGNETLRMKDVGGGSWTTTWTPRAQGTQTVTVNAFTLGPNLTPLALQEIATVNVQSAVSRPLTEPGGIVNAASFSSERLAPGSLVTIFGTELSDGTAAPQTTPIPTTLANTRVELGGRELPLFYSSPRQVNAQVPYDLGADSDLQLVVSRGPRQSPPETVIVTSAQPAVFTVQQSGSGQGVVLGPDQLTLADAGRPVRAGDAIVIYCTGLGATNPAVAPGVPAPSAELARTGAPVSVTIGGINAQVLYSGLAPGFAGLYQVNAIVPSGVRASNAVELKLHSAGLESPPVTIAIRE